MLSLLLVDRPPQTQAGAVFTAHLVQELLLGMSASPLARSRFLVHDRVVYDGMNAVSDKPMGGSSAGDGSAPRPVIAGATTSLEKAGIAMKDRSGSPAKVQGRVDILRSASVEAQPRVRAGASVHKIVPVDNNGNIATAAAARTGTRPGSSGGKPSRHPGVTNVRSLSPPKQAPGTENFTEFSAELAASKSPRVTARPLMDTPLSPAKVDVLLQDPKSRGKPYLAAVGSSEFDEDPRIVGKNAQWSPRTLMIMRAKVTKPPVGKSKLRKMGKVAAARSKEAPSLSLTTAGSVEADASDAAAPEEARKGFHITDATLNDITDQKREPLRRFGVHVEKEVTFA